MTPPNRFRFRFWDTSIVGFQYFEFDDFKRRPPEVLAARILYAKEWQQSTGLLDRNQKEIFEGDIVSDDRGLIGYIKWEEFDLSIGLVVECKKLVPWYMHDANKWEIIGNIYEHPELLK